MAALRVLLIEDETKIRRFVRSSLAKDVIELSEASTGRDGLAMIAQQRPDCVILDLGLPDMDGADVLSQIRTWSAVPVIILTARGQEQDKIALLDAGADDYITKPFSVGELLARIRLVIRRNQSASALEAPVVVIGDIRLDLLKRQVLRNQEEIHLTPIEYKLFTVLVRHADRVMTQRQLLEQVWGSDYAAETHYLRIYMQHLRHKLEADPARPRYLLTEPGVGYRLRVE